MNDNLITIVRAPFGLFASIISMIICIIIFPFDLSFIIIVGIPKLMITNGTFEGGFTTTVFQNLMTKIWTWVLQKDKTGGWLPSIITSLILGITTIIFF